MKVLFTVNNIYLASGVRAFTVLANELSERGHEVTFLVNARDRFEDERPFYFVRDDIAIENVRPWKTRQGLPEDGLGAAPSIAKKPLPRGARKSAAWGQAVAAEVARKVVDKFTLTFRPGKYAKDRWEGKFGQLVKKLRQDIERLDPDVVVAFLPSSFTYVGEALKDSDRPFVVANRNSPFVDYTSARYHPSEYDLALRLLAPERAAANLVQLEAYRLFFSHEVQNKTYVIPNIIDPVADGNIARTERLDERNVILSVGRLHQQKNQLLLVDSFALVAADHPDWSVHIVGEGELESTLKARIEEHDLGGRVLLLGRQKDMGSHYSNAKIFAFPSLHEGFSNAHAEAMSYALPSVGLNSCIYMNEALSDSGGGLLSQNAAPRFAEQLSLLMKTPELRRELGLKARLYTGKFQKDLILDRWESVLHEARQAHPKSADSAKVNGTSVS